MCYVPCCAACSVLALCVPRQAQKSNQSLPSLLRSFGPLVLWSLNGACRSPIHFCRCEAMLATGSSRGTMQMLRLNSTRVVGPVVLEVDVVVGSSLGLLLPAAAAAAASSLLLSRLPCRSPESCLPAYSAHCSHTHTHTHRSEAPERMEQPATMTSRYRPYESDLTL